ncbi:MAG TPA: phosphoribosylformylglycinamidine synthase II, partial [bacterium]|nr:phosphoribosylformylglycinamidine synthase II [bacterium]
GPGARVAVRGGGRADVLLFGEAIGRVVGSVRANQMPDLLNLARRFDVPVDVVGTVGGDRLVVTADGSPDGRPLLDVPVAVLVRAWDPIAEEA